MKKRQKKILGVISAAVLGVSVLVTGTLAWYQLKQAARNEVQGRANPGGRLHDDFNGRNKDIYVENFGDPEKDGVPIFVRVKLYEYMEVGQGAGLLPGDPGFDQKRARPLVSGTINNPDTWPVHNYGIVESNDGRNHRKFHQYWTWHYGGKTEYMPTFNMNKDSLVSDRNGTFEGADGNRLEGVRYDDYIDWELGEELMGDEVHDLDSNDKDEGDAAEEGVHIEYKKGQTHRVKETAEATIVSMEEWKNLESPIGDYWVYDKDGWAYYAKPVQPGEATGLLLDGITAPEQPMEEWYYAIHAKAQFATAGDWTGFQRDGWTTDAKALLDKVADKLPKIERVQVRGGKFQSAKVGERKTLQALVDVKNPTGNVAETYVTWEVEPSTPALAGNIFAPTIDMVGKRYNLTAKSAFDPSVQDVMEILVYPQETANTVTGDLDRKQYINLGDNTYQEVRIGEEGQELGPVICAGADLKIGNGDDITAVEVLEEAHPVYGQKYIGPGQGGIYLAVGPDKKLGTADDIKVIGTPWPDNITNILADGITITASGNNKTVKVGETEKMTAKVTLRGEEIGVQDVTWAVQTSSSYVNINQEGYLAVGDRAQVGAAINVQATSKEMPNLVGNKVLLIAPLDWTDIHNIEPGFRKRVTIDNLEWYVLAHEDGMAYLTLTPQSFFRKQFDESGNNNWEESSIRTYLNGEWLNSLPTIKEKVVETTYWLKNSSQHPSYDERTIWREVKDKVFLPSTQDISNTSSDGRDYTYLTGLNGALNAIMLSSEYSGCITRTPNREGDGKILIPFAGSGWSEYAYSVTDSRNVAPIVRIKMPNYTEPGGP